MPDASGVTVSGRLHAAVARQCRRAVYRGYAGGGADTAGSAGGRVRQTQGGDTAGSQAWRDSARRHQTTPQPDPHQGAFLHAQHHCC